MCLVIPMAATLAMTAAQGAIGYLGQRQQASQQEQYNNAVYGQQVQQATDEREFQNRQVTRQNEFIQQNAANAIDSLYQDRGALVSQARQEAVAAALDIQDQRIAAIRARGAIQASERAGLTLDTLLQDFDRQEANYQGVTIQNLAFSSGQRQREGNKLISAAQSRINEARPYEAAPTQMPYAPAKVQRPSFLGAVLGTGAQMAGQVSTRQVWDSTKNRYVIDWGHGNRNIPTGLPAYQSQSSSFTTGLSSAKPTVPAKPNPLFGNIPASARMPAGYTPPSIAPTRSIPRYTTPVYGKQGLK